MELSQINSIPEEDAALALERCCAAKKWISAMLAARPFQALSQLLDKAEEAANLLEKEDWLEAFSHHPKIGDLNSLKQKFASTAAWAQGEQASVSLAPEKVLQELADGNRQYEDKFGYIFIVCASGKSAEEMLALLQARLKNNSESELEIAAGEQRKITRLRLEKLCQ